jgi:hypothetical protein
MNIYQTASYRDLPGNDIREERVFSHAELGWWAQIVSGDGSHFGAGSPVLFSHKMINKAMIQPMQPKILSRSATKPKT